MGSTASGACAASGHRATESPQPAEPLLLACDDPSDTAEVDFPSYIFRRVSSPASGVANARAAEHPGAWQGGGEEGPGRPEDPAPGGREGEDAGKPRPGQRAAPEPGGFGEAERAQEAEQERLQHEDDASCRSRTPPLELPAATLGGGRCTRENGSPCSVQLEDEIAQLREQLAAEKARAEQAEHCLATLEYFVSSLSFILALGPDRGEHLKRKLIKIMRKTIQKVASVQEISNIMCSIPTVQSEAPRLKLMQWGGDLSQPMEWVVHWAPASWHASVSVLGRHYGVAFSLKLRVHHFGIRGRLKVVLSRGDVWDLSQALVSFLELPEIDFVVDSEVVCGVVPLPVQSQVDTHLKATVRKWLARELVEPNVMVFTAPPLKPKRDLSDGDVREAILDAEKIRRYSSSPSIPP
mmetsp:Transcript_95476/g.270288  ORF Transcript_95476/g.270288 Transcript_95476/m.270288 type:complete len:410 (-) Transcript_95476:126-1355(-)